MSPRHIGPSLRRARVRFLRRYGLLGMLCLTYLVFLAVFSLIGDRNLWKSYRLWRECQRLEREIDGLSGEVGGLSADVKAFRSDPRTIEKFAREELHLAGDNEIQYIFR